MTDEFEIEEAIEDRSGEQFRGVRVGVFKDNQAASISNYADRLGEHREMTGGRDMMEDGHQEHRIEAAVSERQPGPVGDDEGDRDERQIRDVAGHKAETLCPDSGGEMARSGAHVEDQARRREPRTY